jgi:hypothetical protein
MKKSNLSIPVSMTMALVGIVACAVSCAKKTETPSGTATPPPEPQPTNAVVAETNTVAAPVINNVDTNSVTVTNVPAAAAPEITNAPPAETTTAAAPISITDTNLPGHTVVVEMPTNPPVAPPNFYASDLTNKAACCMAPVGDACGTNYFLRLRAGYQHINHGDNNDSYWASVKFYAYGNAFRDAVGRNAWLIPDFEAEVSSGDIPKQDNRSSGSDSGLRFRAAVTWPWIHWTAFAARQEDTVCPFAKPLTFALGPTVNAGFDHLYDDGSDFRFAEYAGARLTFNRDGFIEYTVGRTEGLDGTRQQIVAEIPFYESRDGEVKYYLRGLWNHGANNRPDVLEGGLFLEMPFSTLVKPEKWGDLVPFAQ